MWDYLNRMLASGYANSTTTYAYDPSGARVLQTSTTSTTYYPNKYYSFTSTKIGANTYATSTNYIWNGDTLLSTIDQRLYNGAATGSPVTRFIHPDHLGSTNAVTDQNGNLVQLMDYYPYGATRIATSTYPTNEKRQFIGQYSDASGLDYLQARYYNPTQGQFISQDPTFLAIGNSDQLKQLTQQEQSKFLSDPQQMNSYNYGKDNPITQKDPNGLLAAEALVGAGIGGVVGFGIQGASDLISWNLSSRQTYAGAITGGATFGGIVGATDGLSLIPTLLAGGASGAVQSGTTQGLSIWDGSQASFNSGDFWTNVGSGAIGARIPGLRIAGVTAERGSFQAVERQIYTKIGNGTLSPANVAVPTYAKMTVSTAAQQAPGAAVQGILNNLKGILTQISTLLSGSSNNSKQK
jgi:RHS repeat-associated protein